MGNLTSQITRICNACGIEKPLSAFLQLSGAHGTSYGKICAKCRTISKVEKPVSIATDEERSTKPSGIRIGGKEKIFADVKREQKIHTLKELYRRENIKKKGIADKEIDRFNLTEVDEKKHRDAYTTTTPLPDKKISLPNQQTIARQQTQKLISTRRVAAEHHKATLETKKQQQVETVKTIAKEESIKTTTNFNNLFHTIEPGRIDINSPAMRNFFAYLGRSAPIVQTLAQGNAVTNTKESPASTPSSPRQKRN